MAAILAATLALDAAWIVYFRRGYVTEWDESGYMAIALRDAEAFRTGGLGDLAATFVKQGTQAPLVPLLTVPFDLVFGSGVLQSLFAIPFFFAGLVLATYGLSRRLLDPGWAALATLTVAVIPAVTDYSRLYHFAVPATAFLTAAVWAFLRSDRLERRGWAVLAGVFAGLMLLSRTMTVAYLPALALAAVLQVIVTPKRRRERALNLGWAALATALVAGTWYAPNARAVGSYLVHSGYGERSSSFGSQHSILSVRFWTKELHFVVSYLYLPLAIALGACLLVSLAFWLKRWSPEAVSRAALRRWATSDVLILAIVVLGGYAALTSSANEGTGFALAWLPELVVLSVVAASRVPMRALRLALAAVLLVLSVGNLVMKSSWVEPLARPRAVALPALGSVPVSDGRGLIRLEVEGAGYDIGSPTQRLPALHRDWLPTAREATGWMIRYAERRGERPFVLFGSDDELFNDTRISLADALWFHRGVDVAFMGVGQDRAEWYRAKLRALGTNFLETADAGPDPASITPAEVERSARRLGYRMVRTLRLPDGRKARFWWLAQPSRR